jgi:hypothetical protein
VLVITVGIELYSIRYVTDLPPFYSVPEALQAPLKHYNIQSTTPYLLCELYRRRRRENPRWGTGILLGIFVFQESGNIPNNPDRQECGGGGKFLNFTHKAGGNWELFNNFILN